jgi:cyanophycinase-like exopeptidase
MQRADRTLIIIGGKEDRSNDKVILGEVARRVGSGKLVVTTVAVPSKPDGLFEEYEKAFQTAIVAERGNGFYVLGSGAVYVIDGSEVSYSNVAEEDLKKTLSIHDMKVHMLSQGDHFDLLTRRPRQMSRRAAEKLPEKEEELAPA